MNRFNLIVLPFALLFGACDSADDDAEAALAAQVNADDAVQAPAKAGKRGGRLAKLDLDKDGAISAAEAKDTRLAARFGELDADKDGKLTRDEMRAMKGPRGEGRGHGKHAGERDPAARAGKLLAKRDADKNGALSPAEVAGSRLAERFSALDSDRDGSLARDELAAMKGGHGKGGHGKGGHGKGKGKGGAMKSPGERAAKMFERRDADKNGALSPAELQGSRMAEEFATVDTDRSGALSRDELVAFKAAHGRGGPRK